MEKEEVRKPDVLVRIENISLSGWTENGQGFTSTNFKIQKSYLGKDGEWKYTSTLSPSDLPKVSALLTVAAESPLVKKELSSAPEKEPGIATLRSIENENTKAPSEVIQNNFLRLSAWNHENGISLKITKTYKDQDLGVYKSTEYFSSRDIEGVRQNVNKGIETYTLSEKIGLGLEMEGMEKSASKSNESFNDKSFNDRSLDDKASNSKSQDNGMGM